MGRRTDALLSVCVVALSSQWKLVELELQQLQNTHELQALHEFFLRKEDQFMADWERRIAAQEKRVAESEWRKERQALLRQLHLQTRRQEQEKALTGPDTPATIRKKKPKTKPVETAAADQSTSRKQQARQEKEAVASVAEPASAKGLDTPATDPVAMSESSYTYKRPNGDGDGDLLRMLSQGPASDSEGDEAPMSSLILPVTPARSAETPRRPAAKKTPKRLLLSARKEADPLDFDFTFRRNAAKEAAAATAQAEGELPPLGSAPPTPASKKALKRRKEVSAADKSSDLSAAARLVSAGPTETDVANPQDTDPSTENQKADSPEETEAQEPEDEPTPIEDDDYENNQSEEEPAAKSKKDSKTAKEKDESSSKLAKKAKELKGSSNVTRRKRSKHLDAVQEAVAKADRLAQIASMQDISTPKLPVKKAKKTGGLAEKRAQFQQLRASGPHADEQSNETEVGEGPPAIVSIGGATGSFLPYVTPRRGRALKRKRALQHHQKQQQQTEPESNVSDRSKDRQARVNGTAAAPQSNPDLLGSLSMLSPRIPLSIRKRSRVSPSSMLAAQELINGSSKTATAVVPEKKRTSAASEKKDDGAARAAAEYAAQRMNSGLTTRSKRKALFNAAGASGFGARSFASAGPSYFDSFVGARK